MTICNKKHSKENIYIGSTGRQRSENKSQIKAEIKQTIFTCRGLPAEGIVWLTWCFLTHNLVSLYLSESASDWVSHNLSSN